MTARAALFCFHDHWAACEDRVQLLARLNPGVTIYGLFGGRPDDLPAGAAPVGIPRQHIHVVAGHDPRWLWQHTDLAVREWFAARGPTSSFEVLHVIQWDLALFDSLEVLYGHIPDDALGLTGLVDLPDIAAKWHWTLDPSSAQQIRELERRVRAEWHFRGSMLACLGPGYSLPRAFLERYCTADIPDIGHDEVRLPLYARALGFDICDTGFYERWFDPAVEQLFNANGDEIRIDRMKTALERPDGRRAFHPVRHSGALALLPCVARSGGGPAPRRRE